MSGGRKKHGIKNPFKGVTSSRIIDDHAEDHYPLSRNRTQITIPNDLPDETNPTEAVEDVVNRLIREQKADEHFRAQQESNRAHSESLRVKDEALRAEAQKIYKQTKTKVENALDMYGIVRGLGEENTKKYSGTYFGFSSDQKQTAIDHLRELLNGEDNLTKKDIEVLRDGKLGESLRNIAQELGKEISGESSKPYTVRELVGYLQRWAKNTAEDIKTPRKE